MKRYSLLHPLLLSFYSPSLYRDVARNWRGVGFLYLLMLLALCWIPAAVVLHRTTAVFVDGFGPMVLDQIPTITISNGEVSLREPQPYVIKVPGTGAPLAVIDTTGQTTALDDTGAVVLLTKDHLALRQRQGETRIYDLSGIRNFKLDRAGVEQVMRLFKSYLAPGLYPFMVILSFVYRILQALIYAAIGILFARVLKADLEYPALLRLAAVAVTPAIALDTLRGCLGKSTGFGWWFVCFAVAMGYLLFAVRANSTEDSGDLLQAARA